MEETTGKTTKKSNGGERKSKTTKKSSNCSDGVQNEATLAQIGWDFDDCDGFPRCKVSMFDYSIENHFRAIEDICEVCGIDDRGFDDGEVARLSSSITFLCEWRYFNYKPRVFRFKSETGCPNGTDSHDEITLSQFSAAAVPKFKMEAENLAGSMVSTDTRNDFILYVGGLVWALDWCPRLEQGTSSDTKCEFIAVAAHPPDSTYHQLGTPLNGRGMIQIWCLLNSATEDVRAPVESTQKKYQKNTAAKKGDNKPVRPRGRPRKHPIDINPATDPQTQFAQAVVQLPENTPVMPPDNRNIQTTCASENLLAPVDDSHENAQSSLAKAENTKRKEPRGKSRKNAVCNSSIENPKGQFLPVVSAWPLETSNIPPLDEEVLSEPVPYKEKRKKRKASSNGKTSADNTFDTLDPEGPYLQALAIEFPKSITTTLSAGENLPWTPCLEKGKKLDASTQKVPESDLECTIAVLKRRSRKKSKFHKDSSHGNNGLPTQIQVEGAPLESQTQSCLGNDDMVSERLSNSIPDLCSGGGHDRKGTGLPRVVLCLGHDGKVAWDVKWRPPYAGQSANKHRVGYLAVVLGNGTLEVWEVPSPSVINYIYASRHGKDTDPRFAKLKPLFRSSILKYGDRQSLPLTVEWSSSPPHDLILAGCHDGVVALWKFSTDCSSQDARPLLCFTAETGPIRALSWAPFEGDPESTHVVVTAGHGGLKFWDLRDPFRPLWDANPSQHFVYGLDWLPDLRCVVVSHDDGTLKILSLTRAACDVPVTGEPFSGTQFQGIHSYYCSSSAIWSIHVSRLTGMVAYCCANGTVLFFQLTQKAVDKDPCRNRAPHFLCGSLAYQESAVCMNTELPNSPHRMKKSATEWANTPRSSRTVASGLNQGQRAKKGMESQNPDVQVLALCYGDDTGNGEINEVQKSETSRKGRTSKSKKANDNQASISSDGNTSGIPDLKVVAGGETEVPPPKIVSMYRVRWNMNKGSERWLCYGGAAGFVRCQEIVAPDIDKKLLRS